MTRVGGWPPKGDFAETEEISLGIQRTFVLLSSGDRWRAILWNIENEVAPQFVFP